MKESVLRKSRIEAEMAEEKATLTRTRLQK